MITGPVIKIFAFLIIFVMVVSVGILSIQEVNEFPIVSTRAMKKTLENKKIAMIIAFRDFQDEEYFVPKNILEIANAEVKTVSTEFGTAIGVQGGEAEIDLPLGGLKISDFDAILFIGGPGALNYLDNEISYKIAQDAVSKKKVLGAICIAPTILAKAGVLSEKKATVWSSILDREPVKVLEKNGAVYQEEPVVVDGNIITANGPEAALEFGEELVEMLSKKNP